MQANIYIIEDHPLMQRMMCEFINRIPDLHVCGVAATAQEALAQIPALVVEVVLVDVSLPDMNGIDLVRTLQAWRPALPCLIVSSYQETIYVQQALAAGACGYLFKGDPAELAVAIRRVLKGEAYLSTSTHTP